MLSTGTVEAVLHFSSGASPHILWSDPSFFRLGARLSSNSPVNCRKRRDSMKVKVYGLSRTLLSDAGNCRLEGIGCYHNRKKGINRLKLVCCKSQHVEGLGEITAKDGNANWFLDSAKDLSALNGMVNGPDILEFQEVQQHEGNGSLILNGASREENRVQSAQFDPIEEEAWDLLRDSIVYYCGSPVGTIAANDPTSSNVLNYDQVFIRDFIPSGIAFLLKGEYDIVRNFILHTLQLQ
ncbi:hypothetical protein CRG98_010024, partial [Punica granatum]